MPEFWRRNQDSAIEFGKKAREIQVYEQIRPQDLLLDERLKPHSNPCQGLRMVFIYADTAIKNEVFPMEG